MTSEYWLHWPDVWSPKPSDMPVVVLGRPTGDGHAQQIPLPVCDHAVWNFSKDGPYCAHCGEPQGRGRSK